MPLLRLLSMMGLVSVIAGISCASVSEDGKEWITPPEESEEALELGVAQQALTGTNQACACVTIGVWRDTVVVPDTWMRGACKSMCLSKGAALAQLHCLNSTGTRHSFGTPVPVGQTNDPPPPAINDCGW